VTCLEIAVDAQLFADSIGRELDHLIFVQIGHRSQNRRRIWGESEDAAQQAMPPLWLRSESLRSKRLLVNCIDA
jgi:hypothetical protein